MNNKLLEFFNLWVSSELENSAEIRKLNLQIEHLGKNLFADYEPTKGPRPEFFHRIYKWLDNVNALDEKKILASLIIKIFYVGQLEMESLYRVAFNTNILNWIIDEKNLEYDSDLNIKLEKGIRETWFCPITDSMRINQFYHINHIGNNAELRPEWKSMSAFGSRDKIINYLKNNSFKRIVLLEDFVGSGNQIKKPIEFAASTFPEISFLIVPILMCPHAMELLNELLNKYSNLRIEPALMIDEDGFIKIAQNRIPSFENSLIELAKKYHQSMREAGLTCNYLGFKNIGALTVMYSNTPNNTIPLIWSENNWYPLFNRHIRN